MPKKVPRPKFVRGFDDNGAHAAKTGKEAGSYIFFRNVVKFH
jgi:hypothetical protein